MLARIGSFVRIGIVSDTHNHLANVIRMVEIFNAAGVARVVHTGDITQPKTLRAFADLDAPLVGVFGNNDRERGGLERACRELGFDFADPPRTFAWGRRIAVVHDPLDLDEGLLEAHEVAIHGHDHQRRIEWRSGTLVVNPGECAGHMTGLNAVGVLDLDALAMKILRF